jgi:hypothetical protein
MYAINLCEEDDAKKIRSQPNDNEWFIHHKLNYSLVTDGRTTIVSEINHDTLVHAP